MPEEAGMASNETNSEATAVLTSKEAKSSTPASLKSDEGVQPDSLVSMGTGDAPQDEDRIKEEKDEPYERVEIKDSDEGSCAPVGSEEDRENHHMDPGSQRIIDHVLEFRETSDGLQMEMVNKVSNRGSHDLEGSKEGKNNHHMTMESQNIMGEVHHDTQFKETSEGSTDNICNGPFDDEEVKDTSRKLSLNVQCKETNVSVAGEPKGSTDAPCSDIQSRETNDSLMVCKQVCDPNQTETGTTDTGDETHHATKSNHGTSTCYAESCDIPPDEAESDVSTHSSHNPTEVQDTCNKSPTDRDCVDDIGRSLTVKVPGSARTSTISTDTLNTNSEQCPLSEEESDADWQSAEGHLLDSVQDECHLFLEEPLQVKEKADIQGTRKKPLGKKEQEEGFMCSSNESKEQLSFNHELQQGLLPAVESDGLISSDLPAELALGPSLEHSLLTNRGFQEFVEEHSDSPMCLQTHDSVSHTSKEETNLSNEQVKGKLHVNNMDLDSKSMDIIAHEMSGTESPTAVQSTSSNILENKRDLEETLQHLMEKDLTDSSGQASLQNQRSWSPDILPSGCLLPKGMGGALVGISDGMQTNSSFGTFDGEEPQHGEGEASYDPLLQQSHDDIREDLVVEEIIDSDTIQQPGGDMEEDGQETQSQHDPLLQQSHDDIREDLGGEEITDSDTIQQTGGDMEEDGQETQSQHDPLLQQSHDDIREDLGGEEITDIT
ncbi:uncharacterized protein LOC115457432 [Microcaecilia unicolor]|uniref:Uncharacterized protein LOC115457432 n=1 Tax=Microcaecilia unicolor TaxID=1415580 RepID=A0A6P7WNS4_9AMPH|nr:uncharacterized protein LOC115457432 [Microcaecilia unicolor]